MPRSLSLRAALSCTAMAASAAVSLTSTSVQAEQFNAQQFNLDNGMQVVVLPNTRAPIVHHMVWYKAGAADEPAGRSGIAHLLEHLMFKGTDDFPDDAYSQFIVQHGGQENAFTSNDQTAYHQTIAKEHLPQIMAMEADRMTGLTITEEQFTAERSVVIEEREQRIGNNPGAKLGEAMMASLYQNHPYGNPVIGWRHEIEAMTRQDALDFYDHWYGPQNAILVVAGDVTLEEVRSIAEDTYGKIAPTAEANPRQRPSEPTQWGQRRVEIEDATVGSAQVIMRFLAPTEARTDTNLFSSETSPTALSVLAYIMGGDSTTRLYRKLVEEDKVAVAAGAYYDGSGLDYSAFTSYIVPAPGTELAVSEQALRDELALLLSDGVTQEEVDTAIRRIKVSLVYEQDSLTTGARIIGRALSVGRNLDQVQSYAQELAQVTVEQVNQAAKEVLKDQQSVVAILRTKLASDAEAR